MVSILIHVFIVAIAAAVGFGAACWLLGQSQHVPELEQNGKSPPPQQDVPANTDFEKRLSEMATKISNLVSELEATRAALNSARQTATEYRQEAAKAFAERDEARTFLQQAQEAITRLTAVTSGMTADMAAHRNEVQEASSQLGSDATPQAVLAVVAKLLAANDKMRAKLELAEARLKEQEQLLQTQMAEARTDALTGLFNRRVFDSEMTKLEKVFREQQRPSSVMMLDVDHFKKFNDTYGHQAGDEVLKGVARVLKENLSGNALVCRYGGEEFAVIFAGCDLVTALPAAERARAAVAEHNFVFEGKSLRVTASAGVAEFVTGENAESLVKRADEALYVCKKAGRNCGHYHDGRTIHPMTARLIQEQKESQQMDTADAPPGDTPPPTRDALTGLSTRDVFVEDLERRLAAWRRGGPDVSVVLLEIDRFDKLCATFGPSASDVMLKATSQFLKAAMRDMDHIARYDRHQFALLLPGANGDNAQTVAERLRLAVSKCKLPVGDAVLQFTISSGVSQAIMNDTAESVLSRAEQFLRAAQSQGGNLVVATLEPVSIVETSAH